MDPQTESSKRFNYNYIQHCHRSLAIVTPHSKRIKEKEFYKDNIIILYENLRKRQVKRRKKQECFFQEPYKYLRNIFDQPKSGVLKMEKTVLEKHLKDKYSYPNQHIPLDKINNLVWPAVPKVKFDMKPPTKK